MSELSHGSLRPRIGLFLGPVLTVAMLLAPAPAGMAAAGWRTAAIGILMAVWWITEAIPLAATALVPLVLFPILHIAKIDETAAPYADPVIFLFLGGLILAAGLQSSGLHRRIALSIIRVVGTTPAGLVGGFMLATALLSMGVSNTATVVMMLPMAVSVIALAEKDRPDPAFAVSLLLGIAYAASIGGLGTLIGTPPNALLAGYMAKTWGEPIGFAQWMMVGVPLVIVSLPLCWLLLTRVLFRSDMDEIAGGREMIRSEIKAIGAMSRRERIVAVVTAATALAWIFRPLLAKALPGLSDTGIAIAGATVLFLIPADWAKGEACLDWSDAERLPWSVLILFGGGLTLAHAVQETGLAQWIGNSLQGIGALPIIVVTTVITAVIIFLTELTSNTATAAAFLPLVGSLAVGIGADPLMLAVPTALAASCAFMMPVATPPNALVYASGHVRIPQMVRAGVWLNLAFIVLIQIILFTLAVPVLGIRMR